MISFMGIVVDPKTIVSAGGSLEMSTNNFKK